MRHLPFLRGFAPISALLVGVAVLAVIGCRDESADRAAPAPAPGVDAYEQLARKLEADDWVPAYLAGHVPIFDQAREDRLLAEMRREPFTHLQVGAHAAYAYRTSPKRIEMGRRLFNHYDWGSSIYWRPSGRYLHYAMRASSAEELQSRYGILSDPDGQLIGLLGKPAPDGRIDYGWSCAICHAGAGPDGRPVPGAPNHRYDYGLIYHRGLIEHEPHPGGAPGLIDRDTPIERLGDLGPGRIDMNGDRSENPVKIPALWGLREIRTGMFANGGIGNFWFGIPHNGGVFPASDLLEAVIAYVLSLEPPPNPAAKGESETPGERIFNQEGCASCHSGPYYTNGEIIPLEVIGTDPRRARVEFPKGYRVPTLRRLDLQSLFLHDGSLAALPALFSRERLTTAPGHEYGLDLSEKEKDDLVAFLLSL